MCNILKVIILFILISLVSCIKYDLTDLYLNKSVHIMTVGETYELIATLKGTDDDFNSTTQLWKSSNESVATITNGMVKAISVGTTTITLYIGKKEAKCNITVEKKAPLSFTKGAIHYYGDIYGTSNLAYPMVPSNCFKIYLASNGINLNDLSGIGEFIVLQLNVPISVNDSIPSGNYNMIDNYNNSSLIPYTITPGYNDDKRDQRGSWYIGFKNSNLISGSASISSSSKVYDIYFELNDTGNLILTGNFKGSLNYVDATTSATLSSVNIKQTPY